MASCIAKMYEGGKLDNGGAPTGAVKKPSSNLLSSFGGVEIKLSLLEGKVEQIARGQAEVVRRLDTVCEGLGALGRDLAQLRQGQSRPPSEGTLLAEVRALCGETVALLKGVQEEGRCQRVKMEGIASSVSAVDKVLAYVGEVFRSSKIVEFILKGIVPWGRQEEQSRAEVEVSGLHTNHNHTAVQLSISRVVDRFMVYQTSPDLLYDFNFYICVLLI